MMPRCRRIADMNANTQKRKDLPEEGIKAISLFAGAGIGEFYLKRAGIDIVLANEIIPSRAKAHRFLFPDVPVLVADIREQRVQDSIVEVASRENARLLIATPPCQGVSTAGKNRRTDRLGEDPRNYLVMSALAIADRMSPDFMLIENVPRFKMMRFPENGRLLSLEELLALRYGNRYGLDCSIENAAEHGVPQTRFRVVYRLWKKGLSWEKPLPEAPITVREAIGHLPPLEPGEDSGIKNHRARPAPGNHVECMRHTPTGCSALKNAVHYPRKRDGTKVMGFPNCYKRIRWDAPAPTITMRNEIVSSQENVHPGRELPDGTWSDARVLTLREVLILSSLPADLDVPGNLSETAFRQLIGEGVPPLLMERLLGGIGHGGKKEVNALSMFSGGGIAETYFGDIGIRVKVANELLPKRAAFYRATHPESDMVCGDIQSERVFDAVMTKAKACRAEFLLATPPCQGMSTLGPKEYATDPRNSLVHYVFRAIGELRPKYVMIENVPKFSALLFTGDGHAWNGDADIPHHAIDEALRKRFGEDYEIEMRTLNAMDFGVPQSRPRVIVKMCRKGLSWPWPQPEGHRITLREAIGDLPSLESGEDSGIRWHKALVHNGRNIEALRHTPEGKSAMKNPVFFPKKADGTRVRGFHNTYNRMKWDEPAPARTTNNHLMSGHNNVHPGRPLADGTYSDARVLTLRELFIVSSLPADWELPPDVDEIELRTIIGEAIPPLLSKKIAAGIFAPRE